MGERREDAWRLSQTRSEGTVGVIPQSGHLERAWRPASPANR
jgi:hypothetical protein